MHPHPTLPLYQLITPTKPPSLTPFTLMPVPFTCAIYQATSILTYHLLFTLPRHLTSITTTDLLTHSRYYLLDVIPFRPEDR